MKKRSEIRFSKSLLVDLSRKGFQQMGVTVNISRRGMCIATTEVFRKRSKLQILVAAADDIYALSGTVIWKMKRAAIPGQDVPVGIGVRIDNANSEYYRYIAAIRRKSASIPGSGPSC
jgi:hypothetical protein